MGNRADREKVMKNDEYVLDKQQQDKLRNMLCSTYKNSQSNSSKEKEKISLVCIQSYENCDIIRK